MIIEKENYLYNGKTRNGIPHGKGKLHTEKSDYEGEFLFGMKNGSGREVFCDGRVFEGLFQNDMFFDVNGKMTKPDGTTIVGQFVNYLPNGLVTEVTKDYKYTGQMLNGLKEGCGKIIYNDNTYVAGYFSQDKITEAEKSYDNGIVYKGKFIENLPNCENAYIFYSDKSYYSGACYQGLLYYTGCVIDGKKQLNKRRQFWGKVNNPLSGLNGIKDYFAWGWYEKG